MDRYDLMSEQAMKYKVANIPSFNLKPICPLCESFSSHFLFAEKREYRLCDTCQLIFVPTLFHISKKDEIKRYLEHNNGLHNEGYVNMFRTKMKLIKIICPKAEKILDYGCGYEPVLKYLLSQEGYKVDGYDKNFFPNGQSMKHYDLVVSTETFEHFREPRKEVKRILELLNGSGYMAVMTRFYPRENGWASRQGFKKWYKKYY